MTRPTIEHLARRYVEARDEVAALKHARSQRRCDHEAPFEDDREDPREVGYPSAGASFADREYHPPCWKMIATDDADFDIPGGGATVEPYREHADWCPSCRERQAVHAQIRPAQRRMAARLSALISATRARA